MDNSWVAGQETWPNVKRKEKIAFILSKKPNMVWKVRMSNEPYNSIQNKNISKEGKEQIDSNKKIFLTRQVL